MKKVAEKAKRNRVFFHTYFEKYRQVSQSDHLAGFLSWVWDQDCSAYVQIFDQTLRFRTVVGSMIHALNGDYLIKEYQNGPPLSKSLEMIEPQGVGDDD